MYQYKKSFHLRTLSFALILGLIAYYFILIFHLHEIIRFIEESKISAFFIICLLTSPIIFMKGGLTVHVYRKQNSLKKGLRAMLLLSFYLMILTVISLGIIFSSKYISKLFSSEYWNKSHFFWISLVLFIVFAYFYFILNRFDLIEWKMLSDLKAFPIVSPIFCFGGPIFWFQNLEHLSLNASQISIYNTLSIISGIIFLLYLLLFAVFNQRYSKDINRFQNKDDIVDSKGNPISGTIEGKKSLIIYSIFGLFCFGFYLFSLTITDLTIMMIAK